MVEGASQAGKQPSPVLSVEGLTKDYPGVRAVDDVSFSIERGNVHCLVGENGAGKSTLVKMLTGVLRPTSGIMQVHGSDYAPGNPQDAREGGIATLFQELHVVDELTVQENLTLGMERSRFGFLVKSDLDDRVVKTLAAIEPSIDPNARVSALSVAQKQIIEIARAASSGASVIIMDEPTAALSEREVERLFGVIRRLRESDVTVVYISHKLDEIFKLGDAVTVLRDGKHIATKPLSAVAGRSELIEMMIGRTVFQDYAPRKTVTDEAVLTAEGLTNDLLKDVSFHINRGEIVGFYGLVGAGKTEIARALFGADKVSGSISFKGQKVGRSPKDAIASGIALVPEERRTQGLFTSLTIRRNIPVMNIRQLSDKGVFRSSEEKAVAIEYVRKLSIATDSIDKYTEKLSGGNQQKVVLAKCLFADADLLLLDEPTRGVDVGAKTEIYDIIRNLADEGTAVAVFSSELEEVLGICDRIFLLFSGSLETEVANGPNVDVAHILNVVTGGAKRVVQ
jgi:ribose transport system ATP-binding protein